VAETEGVALNQFINVAVAEKLSAQRTEDFFYERAARGNVPRRNGSWRGLGRAGLLLREMCCLEAHGEEDGSCGTPNQCCTHL
jgi:hypothetical protein